MGTCWFLARHDDKKLYDLDKGQWEKVFDQPCGDLGKVPVSRDSLWSRLWIGEYQRYSTLRDSRRDVEETLDYIDLFADDLWKFIQAGKQFTLGNDGIEEGPGSPDVLARAGYEFIGSRIELGDAAKNAAAIADENRIWKRE